ALLQSDSDDGLARRPMCKLQSLQNTGADWELMDGADRLLAAWLAAVAPVGTAAVAGPITSALAFDESESAAVLEAVARRRDEFLTGRTFARRALAELGCPATAIPVGEGRMPIWPDGYLGSISHCEGLCV